ncbi:MAG: glycoside hydrolase family 3 C-terminal domain-containing protein [Clostridium sp.]|jgi:beta-glucosidase|nr:glycoside hydrolase family 3 C-terminal domain-containing protein [Clostridium sp.]
MERKVEELLTQLTLDEKLDMIHGRGLFRTEGVKRLGILPFVFSDGPMGVRQDFPDDSWVPVGNNDDFVSYLPSNSAIASTWNPKRAYESGQVLGEEARGRGKDVILAPGINIKRDPLCGRNFEYMSEDPHLISALCAPLIQGIQENDVAACVKHFAVNNQETDRLAVDTIVDERTLREIYLPGFASAVKQGKNLTLMNAYNRLNGTFCSENQTLLNDILRTEWGFDGAVISDWGSVHSTVETAKAGMDVEMSVTKNFDEYFLANPLKEAIAKGEVEEACVDEKVRNILRVMFRLNMIGADTAKRKQGAYNTPDHWDKVKKTAEEAIILLKNEGDILPLTKLTDQNASSQACASDNVNKSNEPCVQDEKIAPGVTRKKHVAVIGQNANIMHAAGGGSAEIKAFYEITPLMGLKMRLGGNTRISYTPGYYIPKKEDKSDQNWQALSLEQTYMENVSEYSQKNNQTPSSTEENDNNQADSSAEKKNKLSEETKKLIQDILANRKAYRAKALRLAQDADEVIFIGGLNHDYDTEGRDRHSMKLPYAQDELIEELLAIKPNTVIVLVGGSPVEMPWREHARAIIWTYYAGMMTGSALADILLGHVNPSAKLPETFPIAYTDTVTSKNGQFGKKGTITYEEGVFVGYRYYEQVKVPVAFCFGHGLSYTSFSIKIASIDINADSSNLSMEDTAATLTLEVTNVGKRQGACIVQCYITDEQASVPRPPKELKAFTKVTLNPDETKTATISLPLNAFAFYQTESSAFVYEPGSFIISVGESIQATSASTTIKL